MRLECYKAVSVTVSEIVVISKRYLDVFGMMIGPSLNNSAIL